MARTHPLVLTIQQDGGLQKTIEAGIAAVERLLPIANQAKREPIPASELVVALQCGGSDGWSGVTANPGLGKAADEVVRTEIDLDVVGDTFAPELRTEWRAVTETAWQTAANGVKYRVVDYRRG